MSVHPHKARFLLPLLMLMTVVAGVIALLLGSADVSPSLITGILRDYLQGQAQDPFAARIVLDIRLPRIILALTTGASMGMAGLSAQTLFRNPLASPYVLGVSNGAAVGAVAAMLLADGALGYTAIPVLSILGGLTVSIIVFGMAYHADRFGHALLLAGIAISAFCSAITAATLYLAGERLQTLVFWLMGGLWQATWRDVLLMLPVTASAWIVLTLLAPAMNVALAGERSAVDLGVHLRRFQIILLLVICITTSVAVAVSGVIGFVGLIIPHLLRLLIGSDHRRLVPASAVGGAFLLLTADTLARTLAAPAEIPVGIITALIGAPIFLWFLRRRFARGGLS